jgi:hypothetical protein
VAVNRIVVAMAKGEISNGKREERRGEVGNCVAAFIAQLGR